jgi:hypothetical protein
MEKQMSELDLSSFDTFDTQQMRTDLSAPQPISQAVLDARKKTESMVKQYNAMNLFLGAMGKRTSAPMSMPTYDDSTGSSTESMKQVNNAVNTELIQSLSKLQEQLGRPLTRDEIPSIIKAFNMGPSQLKTVDDMFPYIGLTREQQSKLEKEKSDLSVAGAVDDTIQTHRSLISNADPEVIGNRIEEAVYDIYNNESLNPAEKQAAVDKVYDEFEEMYNLDKSVRGELRQQKSDQRAMVDKAMESGQNITINQLTEKAIERLNAGESWEQVNRDLIDQAQGFLKNKDIMASFVSRLKALKPEDKRTAARKSFDEAQSMLSSSENRIYNVDSVIAMEMEKASQNPLMYQFTGPQNEAMAIEKTFYNLKLSDPDAIDEDKFRRMFNEFKYGDGKENPGIQNLTQEEQKMQIQGVISRASKEFQLPERLLYYIVYGRKGYTELVKDGKY